MSEANETARRAQQAFVLAATKQYREPVDGRVVIVTGGARGLGRCLVELLDTSDSDWEAMFKVNVFGTIKVIRRFVPAMVKAGHGSVINVVSSGVLMTSTGGAYFGARPWTVEMPYQATKSALTTASFYLSQELLATGVAVNSVMPGHTRASWFDATARDFVDREQSIYFMRPLVSEHMLPIVLFLSGQAVARPPVTGRLFHVPDWNYDHGYGDYRVWGDHDLPDELERGYQQLEAALPQYWRAGLARAPFDAERAAFAGGIDKLALSSSGAAEVAGSGKD